VNKQKSLKRNTLILFLIAGSNYHQNSHATASHVYSSKRSILSIQNIFATIGACYAIYFFYQYLLKPSFSHKIALNEKLNKIITNLLTHNASLPVETPFIVIEGKKDEVKQQMDLFINAVNYSSTIQLPYANPIKIALLDSNRGSLDRLFIENQSTFYNMSSKRNILLLPTYDENKIEMNISYHNLKEILDLAEKAAEQKIQPIQEHLKKLKEVLKIFVEQKNYKISLQNRIFNLQKVDDNNLQNIQNYIEFKITKHRLPLILCICSPDYVENFTETLKVKETFNNLQTILLIDNKKNESIENLYEENNIPMLTQTEDYT
jgi:hypothetical protein